ncbi:MAG: EI24 domain-containing protein [Mariprofundales bacterium]
MHKGINSFFSGMQIMLTNAPLRAVLWRIMLALALLLILILYLVIEMSAVLAMLWLPNGDAWYLQLLTWLIWLGSYIISGMMGIMLFTISASIISSYWLDLLACRTEILCNKNGQALEATELNWLESIQQSAKNSLIPMMSLLPWAIAAVILFFMPIVGPALAGVLWFYISARFLLYEIMDVPASRRDWSFAQRKQIMQQQRWFFLGFCLITTGLMFVPIINLLVIPAGVVALSKHWAE